MNPMKSGRGVRAHFRSRRCRTLPKETAISDTVAYNDDVPTQTPIGVLMWAIPQRFVRFLRSGAVFPVLPTAHICISKGAQTR